MKLFLLGRSCEVEEWDDWQEFSFPTSYDFDEIHGLNIFCKNLHQQERDITIIIIYLVYQTSEFRIYLKIKAKSVKWKKDNIFEKINQGLDLRLGSNKQYQKTNV